VCVGFLDGNKHTTTYYGTTGWLALKKNEMVSNAHVVTVINFKGFQRVGYVIDNLLLRFQFHITRVSMFFYSCLQPDDGLSGRNM